MQIIKDLQQTLDDYRAALNNRVSGSIAMSDFIQRISQIIGFYSDKSFDEFNRHIIEIPKIVFFESSEPVIYSSTDIDVLYFVFDEEGDITHLGKKWRPIDIKFEQTPQFVQTVHKDIIQSQIDELKQRQKSIIQQISDLKEQDVAIEHQIKDFEIHLKS